jgi:hypothetical protein
MKRLILACIFFFNLLPTWEEGNFTFCNVAGCKAQVGQQILINYLWDVVYANNPHVIDIKNTPNSTSSVTVTFDNAPPATHSVPYYQGTVEFQNYAHNAVNGNGANNSGGNNGTGNNNGTGGNNNGNFFDNDPDWIEFSIFLQGLRAQQQWEQERDYLLFLNEYAFAYENTGNTGGNEGPGCGVDLIDQTVEYDFFEGYAPGTDDGTPPPAPLGLPCANRYIVGNHIMSFNAVQQNGITQRLFSGNQMAGVVMNGKRYKTTVAYQVVGVKDTRLYSNQCPNGPPSHTTVNEQYLLDNPRLQVKFVNFDSLQNGPPPDGAKRIYGKDRRSGRNVTAFRGIPNDMAGLSFSVDSVNTHPAAVGNEAIGIKYNPDGSFNSYYCIKLTAEDIDDMNTPLPQFLDTLKFKLQHPVVLSKWARDFLSLFPNIFIGPCAVNYVNEKLDTLHKRPSYQNLPTENEKRLAEQKSLAYDLVFGYLYCATNEESVKNSSCSFQAFTGMLHEMIAVVDVGLMADALVEMVQHASAVLQPEMDSLVNGFKDIAGGEVSFGNFDQERFFRKLAERNMKGFDSGYNKLTAIADNFRKMFFTQCHATEVGGSNYDLCCYRKGQLTMMVLPIVLTGGNYLAVKLGNLAARYGSRAKAAIRMMDEATATGATTIVDDVAGEIKIVEPGDVGVDELTTTIKREEPNDVRFDREQNVFEPYPPVNTNIPLISGKKPKNYEFAGQTYRTRSGYDVPFDQNGFPDMDGFSARTVRINNMNGTNHADFAKANMEAFGVADPYYHLTVNNGQYRNYTWHHHQDTKSMMLVPKAINNLVDGGVPHTGGAAIIRHLNNGGTPFNFASPPLR